MDSLSCHRSSLSELALNRYTLLKQFLFILNKCISTDLLVYTSGLNMCHLIQMVLHICSNILLLHISLRYIKHIYESSILGLSVPYICLILNLVSSLVKLVIS